MGFNLHRHHMHPIKSNFLWILFLTVSVYFLSFYQIEDDKQQITHSTLAKTRTANRHYFIIPGPCLLWVHISWIQHRAKTKPWRYLMKYDCNTIQSMMTSEYYTKMDYRLFSDIHHTHIKVLNTYCEILWWYVEHYD